MLAVVVLWALRLALHIGARNLGHGEDPRYRAVARAARVALVVASACCRSSCCRPTIAWVVSWPLAAAALGAGPPVPSLVDLAGVPIALAGLAFEAIGRLAAAPLQGRPAPTRAA